MLRTLVFTFHLCLTVLTFGYAHSHELDSAFERKFFTSTQSVCLSTDTQAFYSSNIEEVCFHQMQAKANDHVLNSVSFKTTNGIENFFLTSAELNQIEWNNKVYPAYRYNIIEVKESRIAYGSFSLVFLNQNDLVKTKFSFMLGITPSGTAFKTTELP